MNWQILGILFLSAALRFLPLQKLMVFTPDEGYLLYIAQTLIKDFHIIWIGVSALGLDFYMGPFWIYFIYPFVALFNGDPLVLGIISSAFGVLTTYLIFWFAKKLFNQYTAIIASLIYSLSALLVYYDEQPYPPSVPLLSILLAISIYMSKFSAKWWVIFAFLYGLVFHIHLSLAPIIFVAIYWAFLHRKQISKKIIAASLISLTLALSPLIAFDYFHNFSNVTVPIRILQSSKSDKDKLNLQTRFSSISQTFSRIWYLEPHKNNADEILYPCIINKYSTTTKGNFFLSLLTLSLIGLFVFKKDIWANDKKRLLLLYGLSFIIPFTILPIINPIEYYLLGFFPLLFIITAQAIDSQKKLSKYLIFLFLAIFAVVNIYTISTAKADFGINTKKTLVQKVTNQIGEDSPFALDEEGGCHKYGGWRYLFSVYSRIPVQSSEDKTFGWLYPDQLSNTPPKYLVLIKETRFPQKVNENYKYKIEEGGFTAYIYEANRF